MFKLLKKEEIATVNPFNGCKFDCYKEGGGCWAYRMSKRLQEKEVKGYENGFKPSWCPERMKVPNSDIVFVGSMGDISFQKTKNIKKIIRKMIEPNPTTLFFLETKDPATYERFIRLLPQNVMISTTIETNLSSEATNAPRRDHRMKQFSDLAWDKKHISIEPVMDFDLSIFTKWIEHINTEIVSIGYDNYNCNLFEPKPEKFYSLIDNLEEFTEVEIKTRPEDLDRYDKAL